MLRPVCSADRGLQSHCLPWPCWPDVQCCSGLTGAGNSQFSFLCITQPYSWTDLAWLGPHELLAAQRICSDVLSVWVCWPPDGRLVLDNFEMSTSSDTWTLGSPPILLYADGLYVGFIESSKRSEMNVHAQFFQPFFRFEGGERRITDPCYYFKFSLTELGLCFYCKSLNKCSVKNNYF